MKKTEKLDFMTRSTVKKRNDNLHLDPAKFDQAMKEDRSIPPYPLFNGKGV